MTTHDKATRPAGVKRKPMCWHVDDQDARVLAGRHLDDCPSQQPAPVVPKGQHVEVQITICLGCVPCPERHCNLCGHRHVEAAYTCPACLAEIRKLLLRIVILSGLPLLDELVRSDGDPLLSEAAALIGPVAHQEAWYHRRESAMAGRIDDAFLDVAKDEHHPLFVLGTWEMSWREWLGHDASNIPDDAIPHYARKWFGTHDPRDRVTVPGAVRYLNAQLAYMATQPDVQLGHLITDLKGCVGYLESVVDDADERPGSCPKCGGKLVKVLDKKHEDKGWREGRVVEGQDAEEYNDRWICQAKDCGRQWTDEEYRSKVKAAQEARATALTASAIARIHDVPEGTVRVWANRGLVAKRGRDTEGRRLYDVADVLTQRGSDTRTQAG